MKKRSDSRYYLHSKKAQLKISFGMIFSIILIISFLAFGFFAIQKFLGMQDNIVMKKFVDNFQEDIDKMWKSTQGSKEVKYSVSRDVTSVCFEYSPYYNVLIYSGERFEDYTFAQIDIEKTLDGKTSICAKVKEGKINFYLSKQFDEEYVTIKV